MSRLWREERLSTFLRSFDDVYRWLRSSLRLRRGVSHSLTWLLGLNQDLKLSCRGRASSLRILEFMYVVLDSLDLFNVLLGHDDVLILS